MENERVRDRAHAGTQTGSPPGRARIGVALDSFEKNKCATGAAIAA